MLYSADAPVLFRDGDLVFVQPAAVRGVIEVKTRLNKGGLRAAINKIKKIGEMLPPENRAFLSIFSYAVDFSDPRVCLEFLQRGTAAKSQIVDFICLGDSSFVRYWAGNPRVSAEVVYEKWHSYDLENMAYGYFIHNILMALSPKYVGLNQDTWFPQSSKEIRKVGEIQRNRGSDESMRIDLAFM